MEGDIRPGYYPPPSTKAEVLFGEHRDYSLPGLENSRVNIVSELHVDPQSRLPPVLDLPDPPPRPAVPKTTLERIADALETIAGAIIGPESDKSAPKEDINNE